MGAAPVLIMLAAIGVDYGWQPDGTTSTRGDNIEYIVQISPDQLQQLQSIGEITSSIDPAVQNRVSRIVVRVGTAKLPRDAGRVQEVESAPPTTGRTVSSGPNFGDQQDVPIPEITRAEEQAFASTNRTNSGTAASELPDNASASVMKPDPQGPGFTMPSSLQTGASQAGVPPAGTQQFGTQDLLDQARMRAAQNANVANPNSPGFSGGPSTDEVPANARVTGGWSSFVGPPRPSDPQSLTNPLATNPPNPFSSGVGSTATEPSRTGFGTSATFGAVPTAANSATNGFNSGFPSASAQSSPGFADSRATQPPAVTAANGYTRDALTNIYNRDNQLVDSEGYVIDPSYAKFQGTNGQLTDRIGNLYDSQGNLIDRYGTRIDKYGKPLATPGSLLTGAQTTSPRDPRYASTAPLTSYPSSIDSIAPPNYPLTQLTAAQLEAQREDQRAYARQLAERDYNARTRLASAAQSATYDDTRSPSDLGLTSTTRLTSEQERAAAAVAAAKAKSFAAQPLFNIVLLISLVGNAYLIFETNNLRRKFRSMLSTFRSAKAAAQPVA